MQSRSFDGESVGNYLHLLKSGGNDYPVNQLKKAGVDTTRPETILAVVKQIDTLLDRLEEELKRVE
jgi:oligoendopeptidase F